MKSVKREELEAISRRMEDWPPEEILRWAVETYFPRITMATAFGAEGCAIIHMLAGIRKDIHIFNLETGYQFAETLETRERLMERYGIRIDLVRAESTVEEMERAHGGPLYNRNPDLCCHLRKIVPLQRTLQGFDAWVSSIRRDQTPDRAEAGIVEWDERFGLVKVNPLANWTKRDVWAFIMSHQVPYNPLHDREYPSIGCWPCTRPVWAGEDERAGRWAGSAKTECGLHAELPLVQIGKKR
jgi:phosphoadenosine phosphosulfate reductase